MASMRAVAHQLGIQLHSSSLRPATVAHRQLNFHKVYCRSIQQGHNLQATSEMHLLHEEKQIESLFSLNSLWCYRPYNAAGNS